LRLEKTYTGKMSRKSKEMDRLYEIFRKGYIPRALKVLIVLISIFFGPILALIDKILEKSS